MSIEGTANTEYASLSGKIRTFVVDKTLTISGACADAKATGDAIESKAGEAAKDAVSEQLPAAVTAGVIEELPKFLDDTLTDPDKAAPAAVVGARLDKLDAQYTIEKIAEVSFDEDIPTSTNGGENFYLELPETLSHYPLFMIRAINLSTPPEFTGNSSSCEICAIEGLANTDTAYVLLSVGRYGENSRYTKDKTLYPFEVNPGEVCAWTSDSGYQSTIIPDTKYLYFDINGNGLAAGARFEIWGAVK